MSLRNQSVTANSYRQEIVDLMMKIQADKNLDARYSEDVLNTLQVAAEQMNTLSSDLQDRHDSNN